MIAKLTNPTTGAEIAAVDVPGDPFVIVWQGRYFTKWRGWWTECDGHSVPDDAIGREMSRRSEPDGGRAL